MCYEITVLGGGQRMNKWMNERSNKCMNESMNEWTIKQMHEWINERMNEWTIKQMHEWMNERINERYNDIHCELLNTRSDLQSYEGSLLNHHLVIIIQI